MSDLTAAPPPDSIRNFSQLVGALEEGQLNTDASQKLEEIVRLLNEAIHMDRKVTAGITVSIRMTADRGLIEVTGDVKTKLPPDVRRRTMLYVTNSRFLSKRDPHQSELPLRTVSSDVPEMRIVSP